MAYWDFLASPSNSRIACCRCNAKRYCTSDSANPAVSGDAYLRSLDYSELNARLDQEIQRLATTFNGFIAFRHDWSNQWVRLVANPGPYGFTNVTGAANACGSCDPNRYVFWDGAHPTTTFHRWIAETTYPYLTSPLVVALPTPSVSGLVDLHWQGGSPPFRVQRCENLLGGDWRSEPLTFNTSAMVLPSPQHEFLRILYLGQWR